MLGWSDKLIKNLEIKQQETAQKICNDIKALAPSQSGEYASSIKVSDTVNSNNTIRTQIYTDLMSEGHAVGRMIEHGTGIYALEPHIGTSSMFFKSGYQYWYVPATSVSRAIGRKIVINGVEFYVAYAQKPKPHFLPGLNLNKDYYKKKIREAIKL